MSLAIGHIPVKDDEGNIVSYLDDENRSYCFEDIREAMLSGDDSFGAISWLSDISDEDIVTIWGMDDELLHSSDILYSDENNAHDNDVKHNDSDDDDNNNKNNNVEDEQQNDARNIIRSEIQDDTLSDAQKGLDTTIVSTINDENKCDIDRNENNSIRKEKQKKINIRYLRVLLDDISYYGYFASWGFVAIFIVGQLLSAFPIISIIGIIGSLLSISASLIASEVLGVLSRQYRMYRTIILSVGAVVFTLLGLYGIAMNNHEYSSAGVIGLFIWSFVPNLIDFTKQHKDDFKTFDYEYDDNGNVLNANEIEDIGSYSYYSTSSYGSSNAFSAINEVFGIPQPIDPPPIEVSRDDMYEDDWKKSINGIEIIDTVDGNIILTAITSEETSKNDEEINYDPVQNDNNDDTLDRRYE